MFKFMNWQHRLLMDSNNGNNQGGGGGNNQPDPAKDLADLKAQLDALKKENETLKAAKPPANDPPANDPTLADKVKSEREAKEKSEAHTKALTQAIAFGMAAKTFVKDNASLLPKSIEAIFEKADKENYANEIEKACEIKVSVISEFFAVQENLDLLTEAQKQNLAEFNKLTKTVKQERVQGIYEAIFEPTLETKRKLAKAVALAKGLAEPNDVADAHRLKMIKSSTEHYYGGSKHGA